MSNIPSDLKYTEDHEWAKLESDGTVKVGITDHASKELGDLVYVELLKTGQDLSAGDAFGTLESVKAVVELYCPVSGTIIAVNQELDEAPESIGDDPYVTWIIAIRPDSVADLDDLLDAEAYEKLLTDAK
ncbi:MAG: glycine cleavage system protein GcvH [Methylococcales bacterium]